MLEFLQTKQSHANFSTSAMETGNHLKNGVKSIKNYELQITRKCALFLVAVLLAFVGFTHKAVGQTQTWNIGHNSVQGGDYLPNVTATLNGNTLTISGSGNMADFWCTGTNQYDAGGEAPWHPNYRNVINTVVFQSGSNVQNIGMRAFKECTNLETIIIPNSVLKINGQAFYGCSSLHTVELENGSNPLQFVGYQANNICSGTNINTYDWFEGCISLSTLHLGRNYSGDFISNIRTTLTTLTIGNTVTTIGSSAFANCNLLKTVTFQDGIGTLTLTTGYNSYTFSNSPIETLHIGRPLTISNTSYQPFAGKATIKTVTISRVFTDGTLNNGLFQNCTGLTSVTFQISGDFTTIGNNAFSGCKALPAITIPNIVTTIGSSAFDGCEILSSISIPNSVTSIGHTAFANCNLLKTVTFQDGTVTLTLTTGHNSYTFSNSPIETLHIGRPLTISNTSYQPFAEKATIKTVTISRVFTDGTLNNGLFQNCTGLTSVTFQISGDFTTIGNNAFSGCKALPAITIPNTVTTIGSSAFNGCEVLSSISIPNSVTSIGHTAFANCNLLKTVTFQDGTVTLTLTTGYNSYTFSNSPIETLHIGRPLTISDTGRQPFAEKATIHNLTFGESVVSIGSNAFNGCTGLTKITSNPTTPPTIQSNTFTGVNPNIPVHVPCVLAYQFSPWGNSFSNFFQIGDCPDEPNLYTLNILSNNTAYGHATSINMLSGAVLTSTWNFEGNLSTSTSAQFSGKAILMANAKNNSVFLGWNDGNLEPMRIVDITDNKTYTAQFETCSNGVGEMKTTPSISVYPNPTNGQLIIHTSQLAMDNAEYSIYSTMGQMIMRGKLQGEATIINVASLINGIYYLRIGDQTVKFVKE